MVLWTSCAVLLVVGLLQVAVLPKVASNISGIQRFHLDACQDDLERRIGGENGSPDELRKAVSSCIENAQVDARLIQLTGLLSSIIGVGLIVLSGILILCAKRDE